MDRATGMFLGALKGIMFSYVLFFAVYLYCHITSDEDKTKEVLPIWIINSHSYQVLFSTAEDTIDTYVPEQLILKIIEIGQEITVDKKD